MVNVLHTVSISGIDGHIIQVESTCSTSSQAALNIIGLPDAAVKEAASRVRSAARQNNIPIKRGSITVNLAPANIRKEGASFDLPILLSIIDKADFYAIDLSDKCFAGELSLSGELRPINGALPMSIAARDAGFKEFYLPEENALEASAAEGISVYPVKTVHQLLMHLFGKTKIEPLVFNSEEYFNNVGDFPLDYADVKGQDAVKQALEIAAAGNHNILLVGPPGSGKSMLAARLPGILPPLTLEESIESSKIYSIAGVTDELKPLLTHRPYRAPHHTLSAPALTGGGSNPMPGEISLANNGVLFLDEFPEFDKRAREVLRQPIENRTVNISRVNGTVTYPCNFLLVCAMNPCKCGYYGHPTRPCTCGPTARYSYVNRISGPILDRIDLQVNVDAVDYNDLSSNQKTPSTAEMRKRVLEARAFAMERFKGVKTGFGKPLLCNGDMEVKHLRKFCPLTKEADHLMQMAFNSYGLSARGYDRLLRISRTIADFDKSDVINDTHMAIAVRLRCIEKGI